MTSFSPRSWLKWWRSAPRAARGRTRRTVARLHLEPLEERQLLATFTVTNANNSGSGSLRQAILNANSTTTVDGIVFSIGQGPRDIILTSPLPAITNPVVFNGHTQPGYRGTPLITLMGHLAGPSAVGLALPSNGSTVLALTVRSFSGHGIAVTGNNNLIDTCYIGTDPFQTFGAGNGGAGVFIAGSSNTVRRSVISGNGGSGVVLSGTLARWNQVGGYFGSWTGNYIGTNANGTFAVPNGQYGVWIGNGARANDVGRGLRPNVISGNNWGGVAIVGSGTRDNRVQSNYIGTNADGTAALGNGTGVFVGQGASHNGIGGSAPSLRNVISGNRDYGIILTDAGTSRNGVAGNFIGTNWDGLAAVPNQKDGVWIGNGARENNIGGTFAGTGNIISGNHWSGVALFHRGTIGNIVQGNYIGTTVAGDAPLANGAGVWINQEASSNVIGGDDDDDGTLDGVVWARNVISGNHQQGVMLRDPSTVSNVVQGNYIGTNADGTAPLGNSQGVRLALGASFNTIIGNLVSGNWGEGVALTDDRTQLNAVLGNTIGLSADGSAPLGNLDGVSVTQGSDGNSIGGAEVGAGNVISGNRRHGVVLWDIGTGANRVRGNSIVANADSGVLIGNGAGLNTIGGSLTGEGNTIAYNGNNGIGTIAAGGRNLLRGNAIYENGALGIDIDSDGVTSAHTVSLTAASTSGTDTTIEGWMIGAPNATYTVELFASAAADPSGFGEGETPLPGLYTVSTDADGNGYFLVTLPFLLTVGSCVSATATESDGTTWEFSNCLPVVDGGEFLGADGDAARAMSAAEASRSALPALPPSHEHPSAEGPTLRADGATSRDHHPDGAAVDAFLQLFGDHENVEGSRSLFHPLSTFGRGMDADIFSFLDFEADGLHAV